MERIKNLELELNSYKTYAAESLPKNRDFEGSDGSLSPTKSRDTLSKKLSENPDDDSIFSDPKSRKFQELIEDLTEKNRGLESDEQNALMKFEKEYRRKIRVIEETSRIKEDLENQLALIMIENETLLKENKWRKDFNIANGKEIETYAKDLKILQRKIQELENGNANWRLKYENQELIKKNVETNPEFRQNYIEIMSQNRTEDEYKGRLSQVVRMNTDNRFTERQKLRVNMPVNRGATTIGHIKEEDEEDDKDSHEVKKSNNQQDDSSDDNLADELGGLGDEDFGMLEHRDSAEEEELFGSPDQDTSKNNANDGVYRASQFDNDRFTVANKDDRSSHINIGISKREFKKTSLPEIQEDEYYDPIKDKLKELKEFERINKDKVLKQLGEERDEEEKLVDQEESEEDAKSDEERSEGMVNHLIVVGDDLFKEISETKPVQAKIRATIAQITKSHLVSVDVQTMATIEKVNIDGTQAIVIYDSMESTDDEEIHQEGDMQDANDPLKARSAAEKSLSGDIKLVSDTEEAFIAGETGRVLLKVHNSEGETLLIDKGKNRVVETSTTEIQTDEYKVEQPQAAEIAKVAPVGSEAKEDNESDDEDDDMSNSDDQAEQDDEDADELFQKLDSRKKNLSEIDEDDEEASTFKTKPKLTEKEKDVKKSENQEIADKIKNRLESQVRLSQFNGKGQSYLRGESIIDKISKIKNFDFLGLRSKDSKYYKRVTRILERYKEMPIGVRDGTECFTEYIYKIDTSFKKNKRKILITSGAMYQLSKNFSVVSRVPLETIKGITLIKKSASVMAIHCPESFDHLIEIVRRTEMVMFLMHMFDVRKLKKPKIYYADGLKTKTTKKNKPTEKKVLKFDPSDKMNVGKENLTLMNKLSSINFINSSKFGYLSKKSAGWFKEWSEKFCVITNIGLLYYNNPDQKPRNLFPIIDANIIAVDQSVYKKKYVFQIKSFKWEIVFAAKSQQDYIEWMEAFTKLQTDTDKRKSALIKKGILDKALLEQYKSENPE